MWSDLGVLVFPWGSIRVTTRVYKIFSLLADIQDSCRRRSSIDIKGYIERQTFQWLWPWYQLQHRNLEVKWSVKSKHQLNIHYKQHRYSTLIHPFPRDRKWLTMESIPQWNSLQRVWWGCLISQYKRIRVHLSWQWDKIYPYWSKKCSCWKLYNWACCIRSHTRRTTKINIWD